MEIEQIFVKIKKAVDSSTEEVIAYICALIVFVLAVITIFFGASTIGLYIFLFSFSLLIYGTLSHLSQRFKEFWSSIVGKIFITAMIFGGSAFSMSLSKIVVNSALEVSSEPFIYTQSVVALLISPLVIAIIFVFAGFFILPILMPFLFIDGTNYSLKASLSFWRWRSQPIIFSGFIRFFSIVLMVSFSMAFLSNNGWYTNSVEKFTKWYAYNFETEVFSYCSITDNQRIAYLSSNQIILVERINGEYLFIYSKCDQL